ncbi:MAG: hypothetical protein DRR19_31495 [Candidatus Parabeggiatoa sp. nov. 1]|nr:MAG: hypothetical protein DRR19_31495 [Gammaproteobacteria bacterium]
MKVLLKIRWFVVVFIFAAFVGCVTSSTNTSSTNLLPDKKRTELGLYLTAMEAYDLLKKDGKTILFVDVRTPQEVALGSPKLVDAYIPYQLIKENEKKQSQWVVNHHFMPDMETRLIDQGLDKQSAVILICRQGNRSAMATDALAKEGYEKVYHVIDGVNGWKKSHLPWTELSEEKIQL